MVLVFHESSTINAELDVNKIEVTQEDEFLAKLLVLLAANTKLSERKDDPFNTNELRMDCKMNRIQGYPQRKIRTRDTRNPNACELHKRKHIKCPKNCLGRISQPSSYPFSSSDESSSSSKRRKVSS